MCDIYFWRQCYILTSGLLFCISVGYMLAFPAVLIPAIVSPNSTDIRTTRAHGSWISASSGIGGIFGAIIISLILSLYGRKTAQISISLVQMIGWIIFPFAHSIAALYAARIIQGFSIGSIYIDSIIISEYVHPARRGYFIILKKVAIAVGSLCCHAMEPFWTWRQISLFAIAPPFLAIIMNLSWPESPAYLALNGRFAECEKSFKWLSGDSEESRVHLKNLIDAQKEKGKNRRRTTVLETMKKMVAKDFLKPILIVSVLTLTLDLCGRYYFVAYVIEILMKLLGDKVLVIYFTLGSDLLTIIALSCSAFAIRYFNRRTLLFTLGGITVLFMLTISLILYLNTIYRLPSEISWLIALVIIFLCFVTNIGIVPVSFALIAEIIPLEYRGVGSFVSGLVFTSFFALTLKLTPVLIIHTAVYGTYAIYGVCLGLCLIFLYKTLPETKDKTLQEINDNLKGFPSTELRSAERNNLI